MSFFCSHCNTLYKKSDPQTYWCIDTDIIKKLTERFIDGEKVYKQSVDTIICKQCGLFSVFVSFFGRFKGKKKLLKVDKYIEQEAINFLNSTETIRHRQPQICPLKRVPYSKRVPISYGKTLSPTTQRARYVNEQGWSSKEVIHSEVRTLS